MSVADTQGKGDSNLKIALLNALRENISDTGAGKKGKGEAGISDKMFTVWPLVTSIDSHEVIVLC